MVARTQLRSRSFLAWLGLGATLALTLLTWVQVRRADRRRVQERFEVELDTIAERIASRIRTEEEILLGASQFISHDRALPTSRQWMDYVQAMDLERLTPGIQALGFAEWIPLTKVPSHVARMRAEGHPGYEVIPGGPLLPEDGVSSIIYTDPFNDLNHKVFARDMLAESTRREALHRACDTGLTTLTGRVQLYQEGPTLNQAGALLYAPVYRQNTNLDSVVHRRGALLGWTYMAFRMQNLTEGILGGYGRGIHLELFDGASELPKDLLYTRQALRKGENNTWSTRRQLKVADRVWTLRGSPGTDFLASLEGGGLQLPLLLVGILSSIGIFALLQFLMRAERRALVLADGHLEKLQLVLDSTGEGIYGIDLAGNCTFCNPAALRLLGYARADQLLGRHVHGLIHHSHAGGRPIPAEESGSFKAFQTELDVRVEDELFWRADGTSFPVDYWSRPQRHRGQVVGAVVTFMDITERKQAEEALLASESMYRERLDHSGEGCAVTDAQERFLMANPAAEAIFGVAPGCLQGRSLLEFLPMDQQELVRCETQVRTKGTKSTYELVIRREDGDLRNLLVTATQRPGRHGEALQVIGVFRDITDRKRAEDALKKSEANMMAVLASTADGILAIDNQRKIVHTNVRFAEMWHIPQDLIDSGTDKALLDFVLGMLVEPLEFVAKVEALYASDLEDQDLCLLKDGRMFERYSLPMMLDGSVTGRVWSFRDITERKRAEKALEESEQRYQDLFQFNPHPMWVVDLETHRFLAVNRATVSHYGYSESEFLAMTIMDIRPLEDVQRLSLGLAKEVDEGPQTSGCWQHKKRDGSLIEAEIFFQKLKFNGRLARVVVATDVTERKQAEVALRESEEQTRAIEQSAHDAIVTSDIHGKIVSWNRGAESLFGYTRSEAVGQPLIILIPERYRERHLAGMNRFHSGDPHQVIGKTVELTGLRKDQGEFPLELSLAKWETSRGWHVTAIIRDITERKAIEQAIVQSELRFRSVFHNSPVAMSLHRIEDDLLLQVNEAWTQLFGWTEPETIGHTLRDLDWWFNPEDRHRLLEDFKELGTLTDWPLHARRKDGTSMHLRLGASALQVEGEPCVLMVLLDHTNLHQAKQALIQLNQSLEYRVAQELNRRMDQERMLVHQSRLAAMGEMIGNIAHQWRQPLNALAMTLGNIKDARQYGQLTDDYLDASIGQGNAHIQRMSSTITDFMDYFRPEKAPRMFPLREQIRSALKLAAASLDRHGISVEVAEGPEVFAWGHANEFAQVLINLMANASDAIRSTGAPSGAIRFDLVAEGNLARLRVADDGGGIRTAPIERIFEPYFTDKPTGTGLGLYMSRMLLEQSMHGTLAARNIPGGAEFTITLPLAEQDHDH